MWPFKKKADEDTSSTLKAGSTAGKLREMELRLLDVEGDMDKILYQLKRITGRLAKRDAREESPAQEDGAESPSPLPSSPPQPGPMSKEEMRQRANYLRMSR